MNGINIIKTISILLLFIINSCGRTTKTELFPNGQKKSEINYKGDILDGESKYYYNNGKLQSHFNYINGKLEGKSQRFFYNGDIESESNYKNGLLNGVSKIYYKDSGGAIKEIKNYRNDTLVDKYTVFFRSGDIKIEGYYKNNLYDSIWNYYDKYGRLVGKGDFKNGNGTLEAYHSNGNISQINHYKNNEVYGDELHFDSKGNLTDSIHY